MRVATDLDAGHVVAALVHLVGAAHLTHQHLGGVAGRALGHRDLLSSRDGNGSTTTTLTRHYAK